MADAFHDAQLRVLKHWGVTVFLLFIDFLFLLWQISANLDDRESRHLAAADTVKKAEEKLHPVKVEFY